MLPINYLAVLTAAIGAFVIGGLWYSPLLFGKAYMASQGLDAKGDANPALPVGEMVGEFLRWLVLSYVLARFMALLGVDSLTEALVFGGWMWVAIYTALAGSVLHERYPWRVYLIHAGDGLVKILSISTLLGLWRV